MTPLVFDVGKCLGEMALVFFESKMKRRNQSNGGGKERNLNAKERRKEKMLCVQCFKMLKV